MSHDTTTIRVPKNVTNLQLAMQDIVRWTTCKSGPRKGMVKCRTSLAHFKAGIVRPLRDIGYIDLKYDTIHGDGWAATKAGVEFARSGIWL